MRGPHLRHPTRPKPGARAAEAPSRRDVAAALRVLLDRAGRVKKALRAPYRTARTVSVRGLGGQRYRLIVGRARDGKQRWNWGPANTARR